MSGYDKSPAYGGPPVRRWTLALWLAGILGAALVLALYAASQS